GTCQSTGDNSYNCAYRPKPAGARCPAGADKCLDKWTCDGNGQCLGSSPKNCAADQCNSGGGCNPASGCSGQPVPDGTPGDADQDGCTVGDSCKSGSCVPGPAAVCSSPPGQCFEAGGACVSTGSNTFQCTYPAKTGGSPCDDGNLCTRTDACDGSGSCVGG